MMHVSNHWGRSRPKEAGVMAFLAILTLCCAAPVCAHGQVPSAIFTRLSYVSAVNGPIGYPVGPTYSYQGSAGHLAGNSRGDVFFTDAPYTNTTDNAYLQEVPADGGAQITLLTGLGYGTSGVYADRQDNLYVPDSNGEIVYIPFVNGTYQANVDVNPDFTTVGYAGACTFPLSTNTVTCPIQFGATPFVYYLHANDVSVDASGNIYLADVYDGQTSGAVNRIVELASSDGTPTVLVDNLTAQGSAQLAVDAAGDVYYCDKSKVYYYAQPVGTVPATVVGSGYVVPTGVSVDRSGNVYITDTGRHRILEIPYIDGAITTSNQFVLLDNKALIVGGNAQNDPGYAQNGVGIDGYGNIYYVGASGNSINLLAVDSLPVGGTGIGMTDAPSVANIYFTQATTLGSVTLASTGTNPFALTALPESNGSPSTGVACVAGHSYALGGSCSVAITYTASAIGLQTAALQALGTSGNLLGQMQLSGQGLAASLDIDPGTVSGIGSGWQAPDAITIDGGGNMYVADSSTGKIYETAGGSGAPTVIASGFSEPSALVLDGAGDLYVGDAGNNRVVEVPLSGGVYGTPVVLQTGLSGQLGLAIDDLGNLYVADSGNSRILRLASVGGEPDGSLVDVVGSGFETPISLALDSSNNLYVSDTGLQEVVQVAIPTSQQTTILNDLTEAAGVAVDAAGDLFAADSGAQSVFRVPNIGGVLDKNFETTLAPIVTTPTALALDSNGNLYVTDAPDKTVGEMVRTAGLLNFGNVNVGATSSTVSASLSNGGTEPLTLSTPFFTATGATSSFAMQDSAAACTSGEALAVGVNCTLAADFSPAAAGTDTETLTFASTAANGTSQSLVFTGSGTQLINSSLSIAVTSPTGAISFGEPVTLSATLTPDMAGSAPPTGTVTFYVDTVPQKPQPLTNNTATITLDNLTGGQHTLSASYSGDNNYAYSASQTITITVATATTTTTIALANTNVDSYPTSAAVGSQITFTATITGALAGVPTGTVTFTSGSYVLGTAQLAANGQAVLITSTVPAGTYNVIATYSGDANFTGSTSSNSITLLISAPTVSFTSSSPQITGDGTAVTLTFSSVAGFVGPANLSCSGLPEYATCSFSPPFAYVAANPAATPANPQVTTAIQLTVLTNQAPVEPPGTAGLGRMPRIPGHRGWATVLGVCLLFPAFFLGFGMWRSRWGGPLANTAVRRSALILFLLLSACMAGLNGCGSSGTGSFITPTGQSTITVNATVSTGQVSPSPAATLTLTLNVN